jgi:hypothetical protein
MIIRWHRYPYFLPFAAAYAGRQDAPYLVYPVPTPKRTPRRKTKSARKGKAGRK